jgi:hypothetical protein
LIQPALFSRDHPDLRGHLGEVLVLAEDKGNVELVPVGHADHAQRDPHVDPLLFAGEERVLGPVGQAHRLVPVVKRATVDVHALPTDDSKLPLPERVPKGVVGHVRDPGVEARLRELPTGRGAETLRKRLDVVARVGVAEGLARRVEEILTVDEEHRALDRGSAELMVPGKK